MTTKFHTIVVGGGCLGCASAVSVRRRLQRQPGLAETRVCILEKHVIGSGISARHSGIVRAANAVPDAARLAKTATDQWQALEELWGVPAAFDACGAIWIAKDDGQSGNAKWNALELQMQEIGVEFRQISASEARDALPHIVSLHDGEVYFLEPGAFQTLSILGNYGRNFAAGSSFECRDLGFLANIHLVGAKPVVQETAHHGGVELLAKTVHPLLGKIPDVNFCQTNNHKTFCD